MASTPKLTSCVTAPEGYLSVPVGSEVYMLVNKKHRGNPYRELEIFTQAELLASQLGTEFFDVPARQLILPDKTFSLLSGFNTTGNIVRLYWNPGSSDEIRTLDLDVVALTVTASSALPFTGRDPFVLDARAGAFTDRLYMTYVRDGGNYWRRSLDLGATWSNERSIDVSAGVLEVEGAILDPATRDSVQVIQKRT